MRSKTDILKQLKSIAIPEVSKFFACKRFTITNDLEARLTKLVNTIAGKELYSLADHGFSGIKQNNSITFYLGRYDIDVVFTKAGKVKDFTIDKAACDIGGF